VLLDWWECNSCRGWFVYPIPTPDTIEQHWGTVTYNDPKQESEIARAKKGVYQQILAGLSRWTELGPLLDVGCNTGHFLLLAAKAGWTPSGFEPNAVAVETSRAKGFDVRCGWSLDEADFTAGFFAALTVIDTFYYVWDPFAMIETFHRLLKPGGVLAMRLTNKRLILGLVRAFSAAGPTRDTRVSRVLQAQFHSIGIAQFTRILQGIGFDRIRVQPRAITAPWNTLDWRTRIAYLGADLIYFLSSAKVNLSPGILLFARKAIS
jgi:SAM-dependent methyltransferase